VSACAREAFTPPSPFLPYLPPAALLLPLSLCAHLCIFGLFGTGHRDGPADVRQDLHGRIDAGRGGGEGALQMASRTRDEEC
jgi:hypothetical protein